MSANNQIYNFDNGFAETESSEVNGNSYKSPAKAFFLSLAVPGLGQYYYGSKIKPFIFFGAEIAVWTMNIKWNKDGDDITTEFEAYNRVHWSQQSYEDFLLWVYGVTDDNDAPVYAYEITHHLPDTRTQQYYEMTGKYDQFSWGWDDADLNGYVIDSFSVDNPMPRVLGDSIPVSEHRIYYENRRNAANDKYDQARKMIFISLANRLISAFDALLITKSRNKSNKGDDEFSSIKVNAKLKSYNAKSDTPFVTFTYKF